MKVRGGWPLAILLVLLVTLPILEVWVLLRVGHLVGVLPTLAVLLLEAALGGWLMRREGTRAWQALLRAYQRGRVPTGELADGALILVGGVLLMLPGFVSDLLGLFFLLPGTRPLARKAIAFFVARRLSRTGRQPGAVYGRGTLIEGEVVEETRPPGTGGQNQVIRGEIEDPDRP